MRNAFLLLPLLALPLSAAAQHTEISGRAGLGLFRFGGPSAEGTSFVNFANNFGQPNGYTNNPYSSRLGAGLALGARVQHVGQRQGLVAFDLGYEWLRSRTSITQLYYSQPLTSSFSGAYRADGSTELLAQRVTAFVGLGHRFDAGALVIDALAGPEGAYVFGFREKGSGTYNGNLSWAVDQPNRAASRYDAGLRADATVWYHRLGFNASYSHGLLNYQSGLLGASPEVYSRTLRLGLAFKLR
ncbi:hypothetical protein MUN81_06060 [Hymenobacter sp. 5317J-9]|uniref:hypothetical protein n=1 Tax=Hymenobacter sp. 5317J-9 TaxID=2932250 RepID=UPI001FD6D5E3|nr:hypothetical protein [Hymenobacter sp. 5317J-9]UOQ99053.1 hypothetical protein MUN81_06060 [Hymenobacter sp. 5317J-9]